MWKTQKQQGQMSLSVEIYYLCLTPSLLLPPLVKLLQDGLSYISLIIYLAHLHRINSYMPISCLSLCSHPTICLT